MTKNFTTIIRSKFLTGLLLTGVFILGLCSVSFATTYTSNAVTGNWNVGTSWQGGTAPTGLGTDVIVIVAGANITCTATTTCSSITLNAASTANSLNINSGVTLSTGAVILTTSTAAASTLAVGAGTLTCSSIAIPGGASAALKCIVSISTGTINCSGNITFSGTAAQAQLTFTGGGALNIGGNLTAGGTFAASTGTVNFNGSSAQTAGGYVYSTLKSNNTTGVTLLANATITTLTIGDVTSNSIFNDGGFTITTATTLNLTSGTYNIGSAGTGNGMPAWGTKNISSGTTVGYVSGAATQAVALTPSYANLTFSGGTKTIAAGTLTVGGTWTDGSTTTVATGCTINVGGSWANNGATTLTTTAAVNVTGNISGTGNISETGAGPITVGGNWTNTGTLTPGTGTVTFNGSGNQAINSSATTTFYNLVINNSNTSNITVGGSTTTLAVTNLTLTNGTLVAGTATQINVAGNWTNNEAASNFTPGTGTVTFTGAAAQNMTGSTVSQTFYNLIILNTSTGVTTGASLTTLQTNNFTLTSGGFTFTSLATFNINGTLTLTAGAFKAGNTNAGNMNLNVAGNWVNNDATAWTISTSIVTMTGASKTIGGSAAAATAFYVLQIADGASITLNSSTNVGITCINLVVGNGTSGSLAQVAEPITVTGNASAPYDGFVINSGATFTSTTGTLTDKWDFNNSGTYTISSTGGVTMSGANSFNFNNNGVFTAGTGTVSFTGTLAGGVTYTINGNDPVFYNLTENSTTMTLTPSMNISSTGTFTLSAGTFNAPGLFKVNNVSIANAASAMLNASTEIDVSGNWANAKAAAFVQGTGLVKFNGSGTQVISSVALTFYDVEIGNTGTVQLTNNLAYTIQDNLTIDAGATLAAGTTAASTATITIGYQWINNGGTFTPEAGTVNFNGGWYNYISGSATTATFYILTVNNTSGLWLDATALTSLNATTFNMTNGGLNPPATMTVTGAVTLTAGTFFSPSTILNVGGNWTNNGGTFDTWDCSCNGVVNFNGTVAQKIQGTNTTQSFQDININNTVSVTNSTVTTFTVNDNFTLTKGSFISAVANATLNFNSYTSPSSFTFIAGTFTVSGASTTVNVNGPGSWTAGTVASTVPSFNYDDPNGAGTAQVVMPGSYTYLNFDNNSKTLAPSNITVTTAFAPGTATGFITTGNTMIFSGTAAANEVIPVFNYDGTSGTAGYNNVSITTATKVFGGNVEISGVFNIGNFLITLGANNLLIGAPGSITTTTFSATAMIYENSTGLLIKQFNTGAQSFTYPVGTNTGTAFYTPITLTFDNVTTAGNVAALVVDALDPNAVGPPTPATNWMTRYWTLSDYNASGITFDYYSVSATNNGAATDVPAAITAANMAAMVWNGASWQNALITSARAALTPVTAAGITTLGDVTFSSCNALRKTSDPSPSSICTSGTATFNVGFVGTPLSCQWQVSTNNGTSYSNISNGGVYDGATIPTLNIINPTTAMSGYLYRCVVTGTASCAGTFTSNGAALTVTSSSGSGPTYSISQSPYNPVLYAAGTIPSVPYAQDVNVQCYGSVITLTLTASPSAGAVYYWSDFDAGGFSYLTYYTNSPTLTIDTRDSLDPFNGLPWTTDVGRGPGMNWIVAEVSDACGNIQPASSVGIWFYVSQFKPSSTTLTNPTSCLSNTGSIAFNGLSASTLYTVTYNKNGVNQGTSYSFSNASGTVTIANLSGGIYDSIYLAANGCWSAPLGPDTLTYAPLVDEQDPTVASICGTSGDASFVVYVQGTVASYQWYENGVSLGANHGIYSGTQTDSLVLTGATSSMNNNTYYCVVTATCTGSFTSASAQLIFNSAAPTYSESGSPSNEVLYPANTIPGISYATNVDVVCDGTILTITASASPSAGATYAWFDFDAAFEQMTNGTNQWVIDTKNGLNPFDGLPWTIDRGRGAGMNWTSLIVSNGCGALPSSSTDFWFYVSPPPAITSSTVVNPSTCVSTDGTIYLAGLTAGSAYTVTYTKNGTSQGPTALTADYSGTLTLSSLTAGTYTNFYVTLTSSGCTSLSPYGPITLNSAAVTSSPSSQSICAGSNATFSVTATGTVTYQWYENGVTLGTNHGVYSGTQTATLTLTAPSSGLSGNSYYCVVTPTCSSLGATSGSATLTINSATASVSLASTTTACSGIALTFNATPTNGGLAPVYNFLVNGVSKQEGLSASFVSSALNGGDVVICSMTSNASCVSPSTVNSPGVTVVASPTVSSSGLGSTYCSNATAVTLSGSPSGGTFSGTGVSGNTFTPSTAGAGGPYTITYTYSNGTCSNTSTQSTTVNAAPSVSYTGLGASYCSNATAVTLSGTPSGGTFSGTGISGSTFTPSIAGAGGPYTITYTYSNGTCSNTSTHTTTVITPPTVSFSGLNASYCNNASAVTLSGSPSGGTFSGTGISGSTFTPSTAGAGGPYSITYTYSNGTCSNTSSQSTSVNAAPTVSFSGLNASYCNNASAVTLSGSPSGGTFSGTGISGSTFTPSTAGAGGPYSITYTYSNGTCSNTSSQSTIVNAAPTVSFSGLNSSYCNNASAVTLSGSPSGGTFSGTGVSGSTFTPSTAGAGGPYSITYTYSNGTCSNISSQSATVNAAPMAVISNTGLTGCVSPGVVLGTTGSSTGSGTITSYQWTNSGGNIIGATSSTYTVTATDNYSVIITNSNSCSTISSSSSVTANANPTIYNVQGGACVPATIGLDTSDGGVNYQLYLNGTTPEGGPVSGNVNHSGISFPAQNTAGIYNVVATNATTGCVSNMTGVSTVNICTSTWVGGSTDWFADANWSPAAVPNVCAANVVIPSGKATYPVINGQNASVGNVNLAAGASITVNSGFQLNVCGNWTGGSGGNAAVIGSGTVYLNGTNGAQTVSGSTQFNILQINNSNGVSLASDAVAAISTGLHLQSGNFNISSGAVQLLSTASNNNSYIDDFTSGFTGTLTGNTVTAERYVPVLGSNQHFISSPVSAPSFSQLSASGPDGAYVVPWTDCTEYQSYYTSPSGTVFQYNDGHAGSGECMLANWEVRSQGNLVNGLGYSSYLQGDNTLSLTGAANTGDISVGGLNNSGYPTVTTLQGHPIESGWNLVGNPYPSAISLSVSRDAAGFQNQVQLWVTDGPFSGSWQYAVIDSPSENTITIAPFQAFMVRVKPGSTGIHSYPFYQSERIRTTNASFYRVQAQNTLELDLGYNGASDITTITFKPNATNAFDDLYDANKPDGGQGRPTLYTTMNDNHWYGLNCVPPLTQVATIPVGLHPEATGTMSITPVGIESFDPTTYIYLEDKQTGKWQNMRDGAYTFTTTTTDAQDRFVLHFTPAAEILTTDASCNSSGIISIKQPGTASWTYTVTDNGNVVISTGTLNEGNPVTVTANAGLYSLTLSDNTGYTVMKNIQVGGSQPIVAKFASSTNIAQVQDNVTFASNTDNANTYAWDFGDGSTAAGKVTTHNYQAQGVYIVALTVTSSTGCTSMATQSITITSRSTTGVSNITGNDKVNIWSNENKVYVDFTKQGIVDAQIDIYNVLGQLLSSEKFGRSTIYAKELDNIEAAYLIIRVKNEGSTTTNKVFIANINK